MSLLKIRGQIDAIDKKLVRLLSRRLDLALRTLPHKTKVVDRAREAEILTRLTELPRGQKHAAALRAIYTAIFKASAKEQRKKRLR